MKKKRHLEYHEQKKEKRTKLLSVRLSERECEEVKQKAKERGLSQADLVIKAVRHF